MGTARGRNGCQLRLGLQCEGHARRAVLFSGHSPPRPSEGSQTQAFGGRAALRTPLSRADM